MARINRVLGITNGEETVMGNVKKTVARIVAGTRLRAQVVAVSSVVGLGALFGAVALPTSPALAGGCSGGTWGGTHGWVDCSGMNHQVTATLSCTWGASTSVRIQNGHADMTCPWGSARAVSIAY